MKNIILEVEKSFLINGYLLEFYEYQINAIRDNCYNCINNCINKEHIQVVNDASTMEILFKNDFNQFLNGENSESFEEIILKNIKNYFDGCNDKEKLLTLLSLAISCLQLFLKSNWISSNISSESNYFFNDKIFNSSITKKICIDGEFVHPLTKNISLLVISKIIFSYLLQISNSILYTCRLWLMRTIWIFQQLLDERSPTFKTKILMLLPEIRKDLSQCLKDDDDENEIILHFLIESVHISYFYYEPGMAKEQLESAIKFSKLSIELTGIMGKRTKFQTKNISQLILDVKNKSKSKLSVRDKNLPMNIQLDDESLLNKMEPMERISQDELDPVKQALILAMCYFHKRNSEGHSSVIKEEIMAYIEFVLEQPQNYFVQTMALFLRSRWQNEGFRYLHRSISQLEELLNNQKALKFEDRFDYIFCVNLPPYWIIQLELGALLESGGSINGALEIYEELKMYEHVIKCHLLLSNKNRAESIIREQLVIQETPELYCYLGDVTQNEEYYLKSWHISNCRYSKAQRSLAYLYLHNKKYKESLEFFEKSLEINPLQISTWFSYGCASLSSCDYIKAATAFRRCVNLDDDNFEAWSNLATSYIRTGDKNRAFLTLQEAIKCSFDNWKLWENYLLVSVDTGHFEEGIQSYHRLLDLKEKHVDLQVLSIIVEAVVKNVMDANGNESINLLPKILQLFGRITSKTLNESEIWRLYSQLIGCDQKNEKSVNEEKMLQCLQKSHRCLMANRVWETNIEECQVVVKKTIALAEAYESQINKLESVEMKNKLLSSAKLSINNFIVQVKKYHSDFVSGELKIPVVNLVEELETILQRMINKNSVSG